MKNVFKATLAVAAVATVGMGSYKAYDSYVAANMSEDNLLLAEDVLALSDGWWDRKTHKEDPSSTTKEVIVGTTVGNEWTYVTTYQKK